MGGRAGGILFPVDDVDRKTDIWDAVVLGAGISGLVSAKILTRQGCRRILVIDEYAWIGGNHISCDFGPYTFDIGTLIFQDDSPLMRHFPELLALYHPVDWSISRITRDNAVRDYPMSMKEEVYGVGALEMLRIFGSIAWGRLTTRRIENAEAYARYWMGSRLFDRSGLAHYVERFYGVPASAIGRDFAEKRMGWLEHNGSVRKRIARMLGRKESWKTNQSYVRPRAGFGALYRAARETLEGEGVTFSLADRVQGVTRDGALARIATQHGAVAGRRLISTVPVDRAFRLCGLGEPEPLSYSRLVSLFFSFAGERGFRSGILYNFSDHGAWKRLTMFSDFYGLAEGREYFGVEVTSKESGADVVSREAAAFVADAAAKGLFKGSLVFEGAHELDNAYPVYTHGASQRAASMIAALREFGVESMGRQGGFDYLPTARHATLVVEEAMRRALPPVASA